MSHLNDKRGRSLTFRARLQRALTERAATQSDLARAIGVDRSTISQLLSDQGARLPNAYVVAGCASALGVSADWLLGLSERPERTADLLAASLALPEAPRALIDDQIFAWHQEAAGYKIRHVPATLPDMLKSRELTRWEYAPHLGRTIDQAIGASEDHLSWMRTSRSDYEIALPLHELQAFARAEGYYRDLARDIRLNQIDHFAALYDQLYPSLRIYAFDARCLFSAPLTVFGPLLAAIYLGRNYIVFRDSARIDAVAAHFDGLVREALIGARDFPALLSDLRSEAEKV